MFACITAFVILTEIIRFFSIAFKMAAQTKMASLAVVSYEKLANHDKKEIDKVVQASQTAGMFYLDLKRSPIEQVLDDVPVIYNISNGFFNLPSENAEKKDSLREGQERG